MYEIDPIYTATGLQCDKNLLHSYIILTWYREIHGVKRDWTHIGQSLLFYYAVCKLEYEHISELTLIF
jgi:hypothetical protein